MRIVLVKIGDNPYGNRAKFGKPMAVNYVNNGAVQDLVQAIHFASKENYTVLIFQDIDRVGVLEASRAWIEKNPKPEFPVYIV
jgi:hypothetical protein